MWDNSKPVGNPETAKGSIDNWMVPPYTNVSAWGDGCRVAERAHISKLKGSSVFQCKFVLSMIESVLFSSPRVKTEGRHQSSSRVHRLTFEIQVPMGLHDTNIM